MEGKAVKETQEQKSLLFVPPKEDAKNLPRYGSYVVGSGLKVHGRLVDAKNSWRNRGWTSIVNPDWKESDGWQDRRKKVTLHAFILENVNGRWYTLYEIPAGIEETDLPWYKEYLRGPYGDVLYTEYYKTSEYYQNQIASGYRSIVKKVTPMSRDEYVEWRLAIQREELSA